MVDGDNSTISHSDLKESLRNDNNTGEKEASDPQPYDSRKSQSLELTSAAEDRIQQLARVFSGISEAPSSNATITNPFDDHKVPALDPFSLVFDAELWAKSYFHIVGSDPERYPQRTAGVAWEDLTVYGFGSDTDYQKNVLNVWFDAVNLVKGAFRSQPRIPILTDFEGLVRSGEMCVVLGRPGR